MKRWQIIGSYAAITLAAAFLAVRRKARVMAAQQAVAADGASRRR